MSAIDRVPKYFMVLHTMGNAVELAWDPPELWDSSYVYQVSVRKTGGFLFNKNPETFLTTKYHTMTVENLAGFTEYEFCVRCGRDYNWSDWSKKVTAKTDVPFSWKEYAGLSSKKRYTLSKSNHKIVTMTGDDTECTVLGTTPFPFGKVTIWKAKILKSKENDGRNIFVGVAPIKADPAENNSEKCGWYFGCYMSALWSGPPHNYSCKGYGPRKEEGSYVKNGDNVGVMVDSGRGEISFILNNLCYGIAFKGIPLDEPLVPCVILKWKGDSVQLGYCETRDSKGFTPKAKRLDGGGSNNIPDANTEKVSLGSPKVVSSGSPKSASFGSPKVVSSGSPRAISFGSPRVISIDSPKVISFGSSQGSGKSTMGEGLLEAGLTGEQADNVCTACYRKAEELNGAGKLPDGLTVDDAAAIAMYTFDFGTGDFECNPCMIINKGVLGMKAEDVTKAAKLVNLLITALRKLPRREGITLYRGVSYEADKSLYSKGTTVTWSRFTSTSPDMEVTKKYMDRNTPSGSLSGTLFIIENAWGYDIQQYSLVSDDDEVILEPGTQFKVVNSFRASFPMISLEALGSDPDIPLSNFHL